MKRSAERWGDSELDQLLARGRLSGGEYDRIEQRVLARARPEHPRRWWFALAPAAAAASLLGVWLVARNAESPGAFTAKGGDAPRAVIDVGCEGARPHACRVGQTLMFSIGANEAPGYLAAYAERVDEPAAPRIWYFPTRSGRDPRIEPAAETRVLGQGVRLGSPHAPGRYRIRAWISETPVERAEDARAPHPHVTEIVLEIVE